MPARPRVYYALRLIRSWRHCSVAPMRRVWACIGAAGLAVVILWISNAGFFFYRDNFSTHYPVKFLTAAILAGGELPLWNPMAAGGQPLAGNANYLTFYPTTLLYLIIPSHVAFNLHFFLHLALAWWGMKALLRDHEIPLDLSRGVATLYLLSGTTVSCLVFYNLVVAVAILPWAFLFLRRLLATPRLPDAMMLGATCGLLGLAAEPLVVIGFAVTAAAYALTRTRPRVPALLFLSIAVSAIVAAPQLLSFQEISRETERARFPFSTAAVLAASVEPIRVAEIVTGPPMGSVLDHGENGYWANRGERRWPPFLLSLMVSSLALPALIRRHSSATRFYGFASIVTLAIALGSANPLIVALVDRFELLRIVRYPEKLMILFTLLVCVAIGILLRDIARGGRFRLSAALATVVIALTAVAVWVTAEVSTGALYRILLTALLQILALVPLMIPHSGIRPRTALMLAILPLAIWLPSIVPLDHSAFYTEPSPVAAQLEEAVVHATTGTVPWSVADPQTIYRFYAFRLHPTFGIRHGVSYALTRSPEGMHSYLSRLAAERFQALPPELGERYLQIHGVTRLITGQPVALQGFDLISSYQARAGDVLIYEIGRARPFLWIPREVLTTGDAGAAVRRIESPGHDVLATTVVPAHVPETDQGARATIRLLDRRSQSLTFAINAASDTVVVVNQTWFSAWHASSGRERLATFPADIDRLGLLVPAGEREVSLTFGRRRHLIGGSALLSLGLLLSSLGISIWSRIRTAVPAR
jgi:hypothetical protein